MGGSIWRGTRPLLLASASRARLELLEAAGIPVETEASGVDERAAEAELGTGASPAEIARQLAAAKALAVSRRRPGRVVVGADQVLDLDGEAIAKSGTPEEAVIAMSRLAGRTHRLCSAAALAQDGAVVAAVAEDAALTMRRLDEAAIRRYVALAGDAATRSVGGYEIEGLGIHLFSRVAGEHTTILGLPLVPLLAALRARDLLAL